MLKKLLVIFLFFFSFLLPSNVQASEEFETAFHTTYDIGRTGLAIVTQNIRLTNKLSNVYATQYALEIGSTRLENVVVLDKAGRPIDHKITTTDNKTVIALNFQTKIVGKGQTLEFTVRYTNHDASQKTGKILDINIPKVNPDSQIDTYEVVINVPLMFGQPKIIAPSGYQHSQSGSNTVLTFNSGQIMSQGITAIFGELQVFDFNLTYNLENPTVSNAVTQVALPPDTPYQKLYYESFSKEPESIAADEDGNWIATFRLEPKEKNSIVVTGSAVVYMDPVVDVPPVNEASLTNYLKSQKYWDINDSKVKELAGNLKTPKNIYEYLVNNFSYNYDRINSGIGRLGAVDAVKYPDNAICTEFTDAFIAIARAAGIPAREINGYAHTENAVLKPLSLLQDVLHSWPEYYDPQKKLWVPVDPTWGNTTGGIDFFTHLDFNHFVFAIHGNNSERPYPAGYYKFDNVDSKDLLINFSDQLPQPNVDFKFNFNQTNINPFSRDAKVKVSVTNRSNVALYQLPIEVMVTGGTRNSPATITLPSLLPYETGDFEVKLTPTTTPSVVTINIDQKQYEFEIKPSINYAQIGLIGAGLIVGLIVAIIAFKSRRVLVSR